MLKELDELKELYKSKKYREVIDYINQSNDEIEKLKSIEKKIEYYQVSANSYHNLKNYTKAIEVYTRIIEIEQNYKKQYIYERAIHYWIYGDYLVRKNDYESANKQYNLAVIDFLECGKLTDCAYMYILLGDFENAFKYYEIALQKDPKKEIFLNLLSYIYENAINYNISDTLKNALYKIYFNISIIKRKLKLEDEQEFISQYTNIYSIHKMFNNKDNNNFLTFRMNNSIYMNDPQEGNIFNQYIRKVSISNDSDNENKHDKFNQLMDNLYPINNFNKKSNTYLISFSKDIKETLPMWVHYGNKTVGAKINISTKHFDRYIDFISTEAIGENKAHHKAFTLYNIEYDLENSDLKSNINDIKAQLYTISNDFDNQNEEIKEFILSSTRDMLDNVRFLFKDDVFSYEEEVRCVVIENDKNNIHLTTDDNSNIDAISKVPKMFINLQKKIPYEEITVTLGSNVAKSDEVAQYLYHVGVKDVDKSEIKYQI